MLNKIFLKQNRKYISSRENNLSSGGDILFSDGQNILAINTCRKRMPVAICLFMLAYAIIIIRVFYLCISQGIVIHGFDNIEEKETTKVGQLISRADITDRNGVIVATSLPTVNLQVEKKPKIKNVEKVAQDLSLIIPDMNYETILKRLKKQKNNEIKRNLSPAQQAEVNNLGIAALKFTDNQARVYPHDNLFSHILGYTDIDNKGLGGLEKFMDERLRKSSKPLQLTLDISIQDTVREELKKAIQEYQAIGAVAIVMDANSGEVISMVSLPDFNPNLPRHAYDNSMFNFATQGIYEAGSVFKTFNTALGLESKKIKVTDKFDATKPIKLHGVKVTDYRGENRWLSVGEILIHSSNIGSALIIDKVGKEKQREFLVNLGFSGKLSEFEVLEKGTPRFLSLKNWKDATMVTASYGYGLSSTPLHIISAFNALINGGIYYYPTILKPSNVPAPRRVISKNTSQKMIPLLRDVVIKGSAKGANVEGYQVIGKTGTANKINEKGNYVEKKVMTSFLAAFPGNNPKYSLIVVLDEPKGTNKFGFVTSGWNAVPTGANIIKAIAPQLNVQADFNLDEQRMHVKASFDK